MDGNVADWRSAHAACWHIGGGAVAGEDLTRGGDKDRPKRGRECLAPKSGDVVIHKRLDRLRGSLGGIAVVIARSVVEGVGTAVRSGGIRAGRMTVSAWDDAKVKNKRGETWIPFQDFLVGFTGRVAIVAIVGAGGEEIRAGFNVACVATPHGRP